MDRPLATELRDERRVRTRLRDWLLGRPRESWSPPRTPLEEPESGRFGVCCSGGGVRSAAYNLGALQVLRQEEVLKDTAYVSAVSGGSYIAAAHAVVAWQSPPRDGDKPVYGPASPEEDWLRNHSSYLAPGLGGKARLALRFLLGLLVNLLLIATVVVLVALPVGWLAGLAYDQLADAGSKGALHLEWWMWGIPVGASALGGVAALPDLVWRIRHDGIRLFLEAWSARLIGTGAALAVLLLAIPSVLLLVRHVGHATPADLAHTVNLRSAGSGHPAASARGSGFLQLVNVGALITAVLGSVRAFVARKRSFFVLAAAAVAGPLAVITPALWLLNEGAVHGATGTGLVAVSVAAALAIAMWLLVDLTQWSLHPFYRRRLSSAFFVRRTDPEWPDGTERTVEEIPYDERLRLSEVSYDPADFPKLIVCAAANVSDEGATPPGRWATPFTFSQERIGGPLIGELPTAHFVGQGETAEQALTLPAAVAMSGAAVSPAMGKKTIRALSFLLGLTNVRLGVWVPNPRWADELPNSRFAAAASVIASPSRQAGRALRTIVPARRPRERIPRRRLVPAWVTRTRELLTRRRPTPIYLFKELFGLTSVNDRFLYVTDGGHYDNLGLIELLRHGCTTIFCLDAGGDRSGTYRALGEAVALARSELQVDIEIDPTPIIPNAKTRMSKRDFVTGSFRFCTTPARSEAGPLAKDQAKQWIGELIYCRAAVTKDAPWDVRAFHDRDKRFPYHSTFDQLFDDEKFESYRALGAHTMRRAIFGWRRQLALVKTSEVLREIARAQRTICYADLVARVQAELAAAQLPTLRPLLDEIAEAEEAAQRPPLVLVVQEGDGLADDVRARLMPVWEFWRP